MSQSDRVPYFTTLSKYRDRYPYIRILERNMKHWARSRSRVRVLEFFQDKVVSKGLETAEKLSVYLEEVRNSACKHHLYLVEDFSLDVMEVLGSHFRIDPYIFAAQQSVVYWAGFPRGVGLPRKLFSMQGPTEQFTQFTLRYLEFNVLDENQQYKIYGKIHDIYTDANLRRQIYFDRLNLDDVFFIRRNSSCWTEKTQEGWDSIMLLEPEAKFVNPELSYMPYQHGYTDFTPWTNSYVDAQPTDKTKGPPKCSMLDDVEFYWTKVATKPDIEDALLNPNNCAIYLKRIVAAQWNVALEYLWKRLCDIQRLLWEFEEEGAWDPETVLGKLKKGLQLATEWRRRISWFANGVQWSLETLGVSRSPECAKQPQTTTDLDYLLVLQRLNDLRGELDSIITSVAGTLGSVQGQLSLYEAQQQHIIAEQSNREAERSRKEAELSRVLTFIALIFVPLAYSTSLFSMGADFLPGSRLFWVYFVVALPLTFLTLLGFRILSLPKAITFLSIFSGQQNDDDGKSAAVI